MPLRRGERAFALLESNASPTNRAEARRLASAALLRDPTAVGAARTLGFVADMDGKKQVAHAALTYSAMLSRRDAATQLWLIEEAVGRNDVPTALKHYDVALRTSALAKAAIEPVLLGATDDADLLVPIANVMRGCAVDARFPDAPDCRGPFAAQHRPYRRDAGYSAGEYRRDVYRRLIIKAAESKDWRLVAQSYRVATGALPGNGPSPIVDPDFKTPGPFIPLDWQFPSSPEVFTERGQNGLSVVARGDGAVARQLTFLPPGRYRIAITTDGALPLSAGLTCAGSGPSLARWKARQAQEVVIDAGCTAQWLAIDVEGIDPPDEVTGTIILVAVARAPGT